MNLKTLDLKIIAWLQRAYLPLSRAAVFIIYFYFGFLKLISESPATPLAREVVDKTVGAAHFHAAYLVLAIYECVIGILFLFPKLTRIVIPLLLAHMVIVCSALVLVPDMVFAKPFVPTLEGQYIIKNLAIIALALGVAAQISPLDRRSAKKAKKR